MYTLSQIAGIVQGTTSGLANFTIQYLSVDSRKILFATPTLFIALQTKDRDGHHFINDAYQQGVRAFLISQAIEQSAYPAACFITVKNTLQALQQLAAFHRSQFNIPVIGITGSNGKTIVKEWLHILLAADYNIVRSPKSYNSQIGVPLSVWQINSANTLAIFEAGISKVGEMEILQQIIKPTLGIITNIGSSHDEGFENKQEKVHQKLMLFHEKTTAVIFGAAQEIIAHAVGDFAFEKYTWGKANHTRLQIKEQQIVGGGTQVLTISGKQETTFLIPFTDAASVENCMHCIALCRYLKLPNSTIQRRLLLLHPIHMRLEWKKAINNCYLLNDGYSNDMSSLLIALDYLQQQSQTEKMTVILSDFLESGMADAMLYYEVAKALAQKKVSRLIGIGPRICNHKQAFMQQQIRVDCYPSTHHFVQHFAGLVFKDESILLKGARVFGFEKIAALLEKQVHQTVLEINLTALSNNLKTCRNFLQPATKIMAMVKAFGYGSGGAEVAKLLQFNKVDYLAVAYADEGVALRQAGIHLPIMVMNVDASAFETLEQYNLEPEIYSFSILQSFTRFCKTQGFNGFPVHIKLDTGMHRLGFEVQEVYALVQDLITQKTLHIRSVFTHLVASENAAENAFTHQQAEAFEKACLLLKKKLGYAFIKHAANTAAITLHPHLQMDMVRLGIGLYGVSGAANVQLQVVTHLKTTIAQIKQLKAGDTVGYNRKGLIKKDASIATVRIGYADGYRRELGNGVGSMHLHGSLVPTIGNVCMDMTMIDITDVPEANVGDEVEVFGNNILIQQLATQCQTIPYEIMTGIGQRVKRIYFEE